MTLFGVDISHHQTVTSMTAVAQAGNSFVIAKATEGTPGTFRDPSYTAFRTATHNAGMVFGAYHFARPGNPVDQANFFCDVAALSSGELPVLDMEDPAVGDMAAWSLPFAQQVKSRLGVTPGVYLNQSYLAHYNWQPLVDLGCWLWLADYDNQPTGGPSGKWPFFAIKQYTDRGVVPGIAGGVDRDSFQGGLDQLKKYTIGGGVVPAPTPPPPPPAPVPVPHPTIYAWNLKPGSYYGNVTGPANCVGANRNPRTGRYDQPNVFVKNIQQWLIYHGSVSGVASGSWAASRWADGVWQAPTDAAMSLWHHRFYPGQKYPTQCWSDDYARLTRP